MVMIDGSLTANTETSAGGSSARVLDGGYWGFASAPAMDRQTAGKVARKAADNARTMSSFNQRFPKGRLQLPLDNHKGEYGFNGRPPLTASERVDILAAANAYANTKYPGLKSASFMLQQESHEKRLTTSNGSDALSTINRAAFYITLTAEDKQGRPVELTEALSAKGGLAELQLTQAGLEPIIDELHRHLMAKCQAVPPRGGEHTVVIAPPLAGMLAHEAMGHPCEADLVLGGAVTGNLVGQQVASELVSMVDLANSWQGEELMIPVYVDDEGTKAEDVTLIDKGVMRGFMSSRETAAKLGIKPTGNARAYSFGDEPLVRMRNTAILPGKSKLEDMISEVEDGYYLLRTGNGQADSTTEFMFGVNLAYEIKGGKLGNAITDTTVSGTAINMLKTVDAVSDDMHWECNGYCGKKQLMIVSLGGPAIRARAHLGGE